MGCGIRRTDWRGGRAESAACTSSWSNVFAPCCTRHRTTLRCPREHAQCSGVSPFGLSTSTCALCARRNFTLPSSPSSAARCSSDEPRLVMPFTSTHDCDSSTRSAPSCPLESATCRRLTRRWVALQGPALGRKDCGRGLDAGGATGEATSSAERSFASHWCRPAPEERRRATISSWPASEASDSGVAPATFWSESSALCLIRRRTCSRADGLAGVRPAFREKQLARGDAPTARSSGGQRGAS